MKKILLERIMRSTRANIYIKNLVENYSNIYKNCNGAAICAAVKADAYGHGAIEVARALETEGCNYFGVATIIEAEELIKSDIKSPIILLSLTTPPEIESIIAMNIEPVVTTLDFILLIEKESQKQNRNINLHLKIDTGMGRIGCRPEEAMELAEYIDRSENLKLQGICTHLSTSESENQDYTNSQIKLFKKVIENLGNKGIYPNVIHAANSGGILMNRDSIFNLVRTGISLYGYPPAKKPKYSIKLKPVLELLTKVVSLKTMPKGSDISYGRTYTTSKESLIATLPVGYADGYFRSLSNIGDVYINGKLYPIVGSICMDQMMVEVDSNVRLYDDVILIGIKKNQPNAETLAKKIGTISYEILTNIHRVKRYYIK